MTHICVPLTETTVESTLAAMNTLPDRVDMLELRLDYMPGLRSGDVRGTLKGLLSARTRPVICTCRPEWGGGRFTGSERQRLEILRTSAELGADYVDVEIEAAGEFGKTGSSRIILSCHNFEETPPDLDAIFRSIEARNPAVVKVTTMARNITDNVRMFEAMGRCRFPKIGLCMGELGMTSRVLAPKFGGFLTFAASEAGKESAPGQLTEKDLIRFYRFHRINANTEVYGIVADPVAHSMSPAIHNAAFEAGGVDAVYLFLHVKEIRPFVEAFRRIDAKGYSVTIPHKETVIECVDDVAPEVRRIGALNTVVNRGGRLHGYNTDLTAAIGSLSRAIVAAGMATDEKQALRGKRVLVLGAGGAGRIIAYGLVHRGAEVILANRTRHRAQQLAENVGCRWVSMAEAAGISYDILINGTAVGMYPGLDETPLPAEALRSGSIVFDAVYNPIETRLLREAKERGCVTVSGYEWFVEQAAAQFELWTNTPAPKQLMGDVVRRRLSGA